MLHCSNTSLALGNTMQITLVNASEQCESLVVGVSVSGNSFVQLLEGSKAGVIRLASGREIPLFGLGSSRNLMCYVPKDLSLMENAAVALALLEQLKPRQTLLLDTIPEMQVHLESMPQLLRLSTRTSSLCKEIPVLPAPGVMTGFSACLLSMVCAS